MDGCYMIGSYPAFDPTAARNAESAALHKVEAGVRRLGCLMSSIRLGPGFPGIG